MSSPVTVQMLRDDWDDAPISDEDHAALTALSDETLEKAIEKAMRGYRDMWWHVLDSVRCEATEALLEEVQS